MEYIVKAVYKTGTYKDQSFLISRNGKVIDSENVTASDVFARKKTALIVAERWERQNEECRKQFGWVDRIEVTAVPFRGRKKRSAKVKTKTGR